MLSAVACTLALVLVLVLSSSSSPAFVVSAQPLVTGWTYAVAGGGGAGGGNGNGTAPGYADGSGASAARFQSPGGVAICGANTSIAFVADTENNRIRWVEVASPSRTVHTLAGSGLAGFVDHATDALQAQFHSPTGVACDPADTSFPLVLYVADTDNHAIRMVTVTRLDDGSSGGTVASVRTLAGGGPSSGGFADGDVAHARFWFPLGLRVDRAPPDPDSVTGEQNRWGGVVVADRANHRVRLIPMHDATTARGWVETVSGNGTAGFADGVQGVSRLRNPSDVAIGPPPSYVLYVTVPHAIRTVTRADNTTRTLCGSATSFGFRDGNHSTVQFFEPLGVHAVGTTDSTTSSGGAGTATNSDGDLYVADTTNNAVRVYVARTGLWRTLVGRSGLGGSVDGAPSVARFRLPAALTTPPAPPSSAGVSQGFLPPNDVVSLLVADTGNHKLRRSTAVCFEPCAHGTCNATGACACVSGWSRDDCSFGLCDAGLCVNGTVCTGYNTCECVPGFEGDQCATPICPVPCLHGGNCTAPDTCTCAPGWSGASSGCDTALCTSAPCQNGGNCTAPDFCSCAPGWTDADCRSAVCGGGCLNGGTCIQPDLCACRAGFVGTDCGTPNCTRPCAHGGACVAPDTCDCTATSYTGVDCTTPVCSLPACVHGNCTAPDTCTCERGWNGTRCELAQCDGVGGCRNGGSCTSPDTCTCIHNWIGPDCNTVHCVPPCAVGSEVCSPLSNTCQSACLGAPCQHGGNCTGLNTCTCTPGYDGPTCQAAVCSRFGCVHGDCLAPDDCRCHTGWQGANCSAAICLPPMACSNGGLCVTPGVCRCPAEWAGNANCTQAICAIPVTSSGGGSGSGSGGGGSSSQTRSCLNGGLCTAPNVCNCTVVGYTGLACEAPLCSDGCSNGGVCTAPERCECADGWAGSACTTRVTVTAWEQWYWYWVAILVAGSVALLLCVAWGWKMHVERVRKERIDAALRDRKPRPVHWRESDDDDDSDAHEGSDAEERREAAEAARAGELLAGWGRGVTQAGTLPPGVGGAGGTAGGVSVTGTGTGAGGAGGRRGSSLALMPMRGSVVNLNAQLHAAIHGGTPPPTGSQHAPLQHGMTGVRLGAGTGSVADVTAPGAAVHYGFHPHQQRRSSLLVLANGARGSVRYTQSTRNAFGIAGAQQQHHRNASNTSSLQQSSQPNTAGLPLHAPYSAGLSGGGGGGGGVSGGISAPATAPLRPRALAPLGSRSQATAAATTTPMMTHAPLQQYQSQPPHQQQQPQSASAASSPAIDGSSSSAAVLVAPLSPAVEPTAIDDPTRPLVGVNRLIGRHSSDAHSPPPPPRAAGGGAGYTKD